MPKRIGPHASGKAHPNTVSAATLTPVARAAGAKQSLTEPTKRPIVRQPAPQALADVALIDAPQCAAAACIGQSQWWELVKTGRAPQPVMRAPRCTRWRLADIRAWLIERAGAGIDQHAAEVAQSAAVKVSAAARAEV